MSYWTSCHEEVLFRKKDTCFFFKIWIGFDNITCHLRAPIDINNELTIFVPTDNKFNFLYLMYFTASLVGGVLLSGSRDSCVDNLHHYTVPLWGNTYIVVYSSICYGFCLIIVLCQRKHVLSVLWGLAYFTGLSPTISWCTWKQNAKLLRATKALHYHNNMRENGGKGK